MSSEDDVTKFEKIKRHLKDNKRVYLATTGGIVVGGTVVGVVVYAKFGKPGVMQTFSDNSKNNVAVGVNKSKNVQIVIDYVKARNYIANPTRCVETGEEWPTQIEAAIAKGIAPDIMSRHLNEKLPNANGLHFERV